MTLDQYQSESNFYNTIKNIVIFKLKKIKDKDKILKEFREKKNTPYIYRKKKKNYIQFSETI